jgi:hypothetical protein
MATTFGIPLGHEQYMKTKAAELDNKDKDMVNSPAHYTQGDIETWDYIVDVVGEYNAIFVAQAQIIKYTGHRLMNKSNPIQDAQKAIWYTKRMIELLEKTKGVNW